jgi:O-6-methylguanine DNA methyltransferase
MKRPDQMFIIEDMSDIEKKSGCAQLNINYSYINGPFGKMLAASTTKGLCYLGLAMDETVALEALKSKYPKAGFKNITENIHQDVLHFFFPESGLAKPIRLHLKGSAFQLDVWKALIRIPMGKLVSYGDIAREIGRPKAFRAVGSAVGDNPVFFLVPCHRVIQSSGALGNYYWGKAIKAAIIEWESVRANQE